MDHDYTTAEKLYLMPIAQLKWTPTDKLFLLWTICLIAHRKELNLSCSYAAIKLDFGESVAYLFQTYCRVADEQNLLDNSYMQLTPKGIIACSYWQEITDRILSL